MSFPDPSPRFMIAAAALPEKLPPWLDFFTFSSINLVYVVIGCVILGMGAGLVGCFTFLRKRALIGDALAHAALPGVCMAFILTGTKDPLTILLGAAISCWAGAFSVDFIVRHTRCKEDSALGMVLSVFYGVGILMLTHIQKSGDASQSGLNHFLLGQAATLLRNDVIVISVVGALLCGCVALGYKELKVLSFDPDFAAAVGMPRRFLEYALATLIVLAVAIGLQAVGVVLMAALLVTPAAAARYWTERLSIMLLLSAFFGGLSGFSGAYISYLSVKMPTGPWIVVAITFVFMVSLVCAPRRGILPRLVRHLRFRRKTVRENVLRTLHVLNEKGLLKDGHVTLADILTRRNMSQRLLARVMEGLKRDDYVCEHEDGVFALTERGKQRAARVTRLHRLWELYLTRKLELAPDHVHDDAEEIEHIITPELEEQLVALLGDPREDPHKSAIPAPLNVQTKEAT